MNSFLSKAGLLHRSVEGRRNNGRDGELGYTLVEILVVLAIIGLIVGLAGPRVLNYLSDSKVKAAKLQIASFSTVLDLYYLDNGRYPTSNEGLAALIQKPETASTWRGPYLKSSIVPTDPWGRPYVYRSPGQQAPFEILSLGAEGREGGGANNSENITSWQQQ